MTKAEAIDALTDGHTIYDLGYVKDICKTLGVEVPKKLVKKFYSDPPGTFKGLTMKVEGSPGVYSLELSRYVAWKLGVDEKAGEYHGRGSQARAYADEVAKVLQVA